MNVGLLRRFWCSLRGGHEWWSWHLLLQKWVPTPDWLAGNTTDYRQMRCSRCGHEQPQTFKPTFMQADYVRRTDPVFRQQVKDTARRMLDY